MPSCRDCDGLGRVLRRKTTERAAQAAALERGRGLLGKARAEFAKVKGLRARQVVGMIEDALDLAAKL